MHVMHVIQVLQESAMEVAHDVHDKRLMEIILRGLV
jgi:hypothetical protein